MNFAQMSKQSLDGALRALVEVKIGGWHGRVTTPPFTRGAERLRSRWRVVGEDHPRGLLGHLAAAAHRDPDVGFVQRRTVVHAVAVGVARQRHRVVEQLIVVTAHVKKWVIKQIIAENQIERKCGRHRRRLRTGAGAVAALVGYHGGASAATAALSPWQGPLAGLGATRFTSEDQVPDLFPGWEIERVERATHTEGNGAHEIRHLVIHGVKR